MTAANEVEIAWGEYHPSQADKAQGKGIGTWVWESLQGDFNPERSVGQISFDMVISLIPVIDTVCDIRDLCANVQEYKKDPDNKLTMFFIALTVVGFIPGIGSVVKGVVKIVFAYLRKYVTKMDDLFAAGQFAKVVGRATDAAIPKIYEYLQNSRWVRWATNNRVPDMFKFAAKELNAFADKFSVSKLQAGFDEGIKVLNKLLFKLKPIVPTTIQEKIIDLQKTISQSSGKMRAGIGQHTENIRNAMHIIAKKLDDHYWVVTTQTVNRGWIAPMASSTAAEMMRKNKPKYVSAITEEGLKYKPIDPKKYSPKLAAKIATFTKAHPGRTLPDLSQREGAEIKNFSHDIYAALLPPDTKLYRLIDPTNDAGGPWWISEAEFKTLKQMKQGAKDEWRKRFAVKPDWNQDGKYVEYTVPDGGLPVWRGKAASQAVDEHHQLAGGHEQFYFQPVRDSYAGDPKFNPDQRITFTDQKGKPVDKKLSVKINDPHIKGPFDTGWGYDTIYPTVTGKVGLPLPPEQ